MSTLDRNYSSTYKILVLGESGVGKTSIIRRFTEEQYQESYISTIGIDSRAKVVSIEEDKVRLQIWDTAGQERFRTLTSAYYRGAMGIILVYDITSDFSFSSINHWLETIDQNAAPNVCKVLVGNKIDCNQELRVVPRSKGEERAESKGLKFFEASAKANTNVTEIFMSMAELISIEKKKKAKAIPDATEILRKPDNRGSSSCC